ncbi:unnamed protein product [Symbiodinium natans]|uniref:Uncharacterized protein n=1 Tax=Symbiodinium natans TaxID=878477 RepID=A0A812R1C3_9DINO|nr:unnamed protein product [Symbiodinium natans]
MLQLRQDVSGELQEHRHRAEESQKDLASELKQLVDQSRSEVSAELAKTLKAVQGPLELQEMLATARQELKDELETLQELRRKIEAAAAEDSKARLQDSVCPFARCFLKAAGDQATELRGIFEQHTAQLESLQAHTFEAPAKRVASDKWRRLSWSATRL